MLGLKHGLKYSKCLQKMFPHTVSVDSVEGSRRTRRGHGGLTEDTWRTRGGHGGPPGVVSIQSKALSLFLDWVSAINLTVISGSPVNQTTGVHLAKLILKIEPIFPKKTGKLH